MIVWKQNTFQYVPCIFGYKLHKNGSIQEECIMPPAHFDGEVANVVACFDQWNANGADKQKL